MKDELHHHMKNNNIFQKAKEDMLDCLTNLKVWHIQGQLTKQACRALAQIAKCVEFQEISFKTAIFSLSFMDIGQ